MTDDIEQRLRDDAERFQQQISSPEYRAAEERSLRRVLEMLEEHGDR